MAASNAIRAGRAFVELFADDKPLVRGLQAAQARLKTFGASVAKLGAGMVAVGAAIAAPLAAAVGKFSAVGDSFDKMSARTGLAVESISQMAFVLDQSGTSTEAFEKGVRTMQRTLGEAAAGSKTAQEAFAALGLDFKKLLALSPEQQFLAIAQAVSEINNPALQTAAAMDVLGRSGAELLPTMQMGADGIRAMMQQANALGLTMSGETASSAAALNDALGAMQTIVQAVALTIGAALAPAVTQVATQLTVAGAAARAWIADNQQLVTIVAQVAAGLVAGGGALIGFGAAFGAMGTGIGAVVSTLTTFSSLISGAVAVIGALASPLGIVVAGIAAIAAATIDWTAAWQTIQGIGASTLEALSGGFAGVQAAAQPVFDAIAAGAAALVEKIQPIVDLVMGALSTAWQTVSEAASAALGFIAGLIKENEATITEWGTLTVEIWRNAVEGVIALWGGIVEAAGTAINWINEQWQNLFGQTFTESVATAFGFVVNQVKLILDWISLLTTNWDLTWKLVKNAAGTALFFVLDLVPKVALAIIGVIKGAAAATGELIAAIASGDFEGIASKMAGLFADAFKESMSEETPFTGILNDFKAERDEIVADMVKARDATRADRAQADAAKAAARPTATPAAAPRISPTLPAVAAAAAAAAAQAVQAPSPEAVDAGEAIAKAADKMADSQEKVPEAMALGSKEASEHILKSISAGAQNKPDARAYIEAGKQAIAELKKVNENLKHAPLLAASAIN